MTEEPKKPSPTPRPAPMPTPDEKREQGNVITKMPPKQPEKRG